MAKHSNRRRPQRHTFRRTVVRLARRAALAILSEVVATAIRLIIAQYLPEVLPPLR
jgi:hypothetical protein